jgi:hypothetical protein
MRMRALGFIALAGVTVLLPACRGNKAKVGAVHSADMIFDDNQWYVIATTPKGSREFDAWQSKTTLAALYAQAKAAAQSDCGGDAVCIRGLRYTTAVTCLNVWSPPPPQRPLSQPLLQHCYDGVNQALQFIRSSGLPAEDLDQSLRDVNSVLQTIAIQLRGMPDSVAAKKQALIGSASATLKNEGMAVVGQEKMALADLKQNTLAVQAILSTYTSGVSALNGQFAALTQSYQAYRALEPSTMSKLAQIATQASTSDLTNFAAIQDQLLMLDASEAQLPEQLVLLTNRMSSQLLQQQQLFDDHIAPYLDFMKTQNLSKPDATTVALRSLDAMYHYSIGREDNVRRAISKIIDGLAQRIQALVLQNANTASQPALAAAAQLAASTDFVNQVNERISNLWQTPPVSVNLQLPYLSAQHDRVTTFLGLEPMCTGTVPSYMQTGCKLLQPEFSRAHSYMKSGLASNLRLAVYFMSQANVSPTLLVNLQADLTAGKLAQAVLDNDAILHATDSPTLPPPPDGGVDGGSVGVDNTGSDE